MADGQDDLSADGGDPLVFVICGDDDDDAESRRDELQTKLEGFISLYETCPALWNPKHKYYTNTLKRNEDLDKLLQVYKIMKPNATRDDVRKKINSLRSNYRKELKKAEHSKRSGCIAAEIYKPTSKTFYLLKFLENIDKPKVTKYLQNVESSEIRSEEDNSVIISTIKEESRPVKIRKTSEALAKGHELFNRPCTLQPQPSSSQDVDPIVLVWSDKLKNLDPAQRLYAEKAINDVLFEAQLNNLHRNYVQINNFAKNSSPSTSTPYPYTTSPLRKHDSD